MAEAADLMPASSLPELAALAGHCRRCPLHANATQTVFGEGPAGAMVMFVGEQPGDQEDLAGRPFVGPAGKLFDAALAAAGLDRDGVYVTNAVKHFKHEPRGKFRLHKRPDAGEVTACKWWLAQEIRLVQPRLIVALGATAAAALTGTGKAVLERRGTVERTADGLLVFITAHPSSVLRTPAPHRASAEAAFNADIAAVVRIGDGSSGH